ncbi:porin [Alishewanella tabrizica]|uniref:Porin n=1 Tax=Alishewanella tabrizica TaxID=671278 RepID=A0ABQ2WPI8_9ALTE|nr:porin [Alishewanella tabrizica]GGW67167.1 porin [Alishewanella tabrizica]
MKQVNRTTLALAALCSPTFFIALPAFANSITLPVPSVTLYGKAEVQLAHTDKGVMRYTEQGTQLDMPFSRFGLRGEQVLNEHITAFFTYEVDVRGFDEANTQSPFSARNTFIGIKGNFGQLIAGRNDTRLKTSEGGVDLYNETSGDIAQILPGQDRLGDSLTYISPKFAGFELSATYVLGQDNERQNGKDGVAVSLAYGDRALKSLPYYLTLTRAQSLSGLDATRLLAQHQVGDFTLGALLQYSEASEGTASGTGGYVSVQYTYGNWLPKIQAGRDTSELRQTSAANHYTAGVDYIFNSQSKAYFYVTQLELTDTRDTSVALGLQYRF